MMAFALFVRLKEQESAKSYFSVKVTLFTYLMLQVLFNFLYFLLAIPTQYLYVFPVLQASLSQMLTSSYLVSRS